MFKLLVAEQTVALLKDCLDCKAIPPLQKKKAELPGERDYLIKKLRLLILLVHTVLLGFHYIPSFFFALQYMSNFFDIFCDSILKYVLK